MVGVRVLAIPYGGDAQHLAEAFDRRIRAARRGRRQRMARECGLHARGVDEQDRSEGRDDGEDDENDEHGTTFSHEGR